MPFLELLACNYSHNISKCEPFSALKSEAVVNVCGKTTDGLKDIEILIEAYLTEHGINSRILEY